MEDVNAFSAGVATVICWKKLTFSLQVFGTPGALTSQGQDKHLTLETWGKRGYWTSTFLSSSNYHNEIDRKLTGLHASEEHFEEVGDHLFSKLAQCHCTARTKYICTSFKMQANR